MFNGDTRHYNKIKMTEKYKNHVRSPLSDVIVSLNSAEFTLDFALTGEKKAACGGDLA